MKQTLIALIDCDNFFVSCERLFRPDLRSKPVAVLSNNDGCIISRSSEVKALNIPMGAPLFKYKDVIRLHNVHIFSSNFALYSDLSERVMNVLKSECDKVQVYSVDEAFVEIDVSTVCDPLEYAKYLKDTIKQQVGIPVSIGIGRTKTRAKAATEIAKKVEKYKVDLKYEHICNIEDSKALSALEYFDVENIWGIGRKLSRFLRDNYIYTAQEFMDAPDTWIKAHMGITGLLKVRDLRGEHASKIRLRSEPKKGIISSRSFGKKISREEEVWSAVEYHVGHAAEKLRAQNSLAVNLRVYLFVDAPRDKDEIYSNIDKRTHSISKGKYRVAHTISIDVPTSYTPTLLKYARECFKNIYSKSERYKKAGVAITEIVKSGMVQVTLDGEGTDIEKNKKETRYIQTYDLLKDSYGDYIHFGTVDNQRTWFSKRDKRSPRYTTSWKDIARINI